MKQEAGFWTQLDAEVRQLRDSLPNDAAAKQRGYSILTGPPVPGELLLMGLHPRYEPGARAPDSQHRGPSEIAGAPSHRLRHLIDAAGLEDANAQALSHVLTRANETYLWFFGASGAPEWKSADFWGARGEDLRAEVEAACLNWQERLLPALRPAGILCLGLAIHGNLADRWGDQLHEHAVTRCPDRPGRLAVEADIEIAGRTAPFLAIRQSRDDWASAPAEERAALGGALARFITRADLR